MSIEINYTFLYNEEMYPRIIKNISLNNDLIDSTTLDFPSEYENIPIETLKEFSNFLLEKFNYIISILVDSNLNQYKFNSLVDPIKVICRMKTSCDNLIFSLENPETDPQNPFPPLESE